MDKQIHKDIKKHIFKDELYACQESEDIIDYLKLVRRTSS